MNSGKYAFSAPVDLIRASMSACMRSQTAYAVGRITIVPRTGPLSASSALAITSWYQRGKSSARGVSTRAMVSHLNEGPAQPVQRAIRRSDRDHPAPQHDHLRVQHRTQVAARVLGVHGQVREAALFDPAEPQP